MKRVMITGLFIFGIAACAQAQAVNGNSSTTTRNVSTTTKHAKKSKGARVKPSDTLNNRKTYHFSNGQRSTPTGAEATASNGSGYAAIGKDTTATVVGTAPARKKSTTRSSTFKKKQQ